MNKSLPVAQDATSRHASRLKLAGISIFVIGLMCSGLVYWWGTRSANDSSDDLAMMNYNQPQEHQMEMLYGKQGRLIQDISNALKQPGTQAILIIIVSSLITAGCFFAARPSQSQPDTQAKIDA